MLDITPTTGDYIPALGTNYTGSSRFPLYCGETTVNGRTLTAVCALAAKIQANLDRLYPTGGWNVLVDTESTYTDSAGNTVLVTHTEDKVLSFDNTTVVQALAEVHNTFGLNYSIRGRNIYIGYGLNDLTSDDQDETFAFGYGRGYPTRNDSGKALFQIKRIANSQQKVVTRLRAFGSTKNMPYRYYNKKYDLSQALFPTNLQLPDTFIPEGSTDDAAGTNSKWGHNKQRPSYLRAVKGDTNDAYIDKNDDAAGCVEGIREDSARWDGSSGDLPEIYPTIEEATFGELRGALVPDQDGQTGSGSYPGYDSSERVDSLLTVGYLSGGTLIDDANVGDGILSEDGTTDRGISRSAAVGLTTLNYNARNGGDFTNSGSYYAGRERSLFTIQDVAAGNYAMTPTIGAVKYGFSLSCYRTGISAKVGFRIIVRQTSKATGTSTTIATYISDFISTSLSDGIKEVELPEIPDVKEGSSAKVTTLTVTELSDITVSFVPTLSDISAPADFTDNISLIYMVGNSRLDSSVTYQPEYTWISTDGSSESSSTFHVFVKDMGFDITACWTDDAPVLAMKSGRCVGRQFEIGENVQKVTYQGKKGYMLTLTRATDSSLNTYYPSETDPIAAGDYFVLLNISMPDAYVKMAEVRLLRAATDYLADNCETKFTYQPQLDHIYLQRNYDNMVANGTPEKSIFWRLYAGLKFTFRGIPSSVDDPLPVADITISQVSISMGDGLTPKVEITLNDDVQQTTLQKLTTSVDRIYNGSLFSGGAGGSTSANMAALRSLLQTEGERRFLSKEHDDVAAGKITFAKNTSFRNGLGSTDYSQGELGSGYHIGKYGNTNDSYLEIDRLLVRKMAYFVELAVKRLDHVGGSVGVSPADLTISDVEVLDDVYRCYVDLTDGHSTINIEDWQVDDLARCQTFNLNQATYYWRAVDNVDYQNGYVDLSIEDCDAGSGIPKRGDVLVVVGNKTDATRQNFIEISSTGSSSPSIKIYHGINDYSLVDKDATSFEYDPTTGRMKMVVYGDMYVGDRLQTNYMSFSQDGGLRIRAAYAEFGHTGTDGQVSYKTIDEIIEEISQQDDKSFLVWRSETDDEPSASSEPESEWTTDKIRDEHIGDIYLNSDGLCWEYKHIDGLGYYWQAVSDAYLISALQKVRTKKRCFTGVYGTNTPTSGEYSKGDMWVKATYADDSISYGNEMLVCISDGDWSSFSIADWDLANDYQQRLDTMSEDFQEWKEEIESQVDGSAESFITTSNEDPSLEWDASEYQEHKGDIWVQEDKELSYYWNGKKWMPSSVDLYALTDKVDGKATVFVSKPNAKRYNTDGSLKDDGYLYRERDIWILENDDVYAGYEKGTIMVATASSNTTYNASHWAKKDCYTNGMSDADKDVFRTAGFDYDAREFHFYADKFFFRNRNTTNPKDIAIIEEDANGNGYIRTDLIKASEIITQTVVALDVNGNVLSKYNGNGNGTVVYYYPNGTKMKEDVFIYNSSGEITGMRTYYYNSDGSVSWYITESGVITSTLAYYWQSLGYRGVVTSTDASTINELTYLVSNGTWNTKINNSFARQISEFHADGTATSTMQQYNGLTCYGNYDNESPTDSTVAANHVTGYVAYETTIQTDARFVDDSGQMRKGYHFGYYNDGYCDAPDAYFVCIDGTAWDSESEEQLV